MKYIENPLIIQKRKSDIRMYVLVTSWDPLVVWNFEECLVRLAFAEYDPDSTDRLSHLTNDRVWNAAAEE